MESKAGLQWRKSSFSGGAQQCVEVAVTPDGSRYVRDTKDRPAGHLTATCDSWLAFIAEVRTGEFD
ncbi:DUF397 domain-containing protein [Amycolatopsis sp. NPDC004368]